MRRSISAISAKLNVLAVAAVLALGLSACDSGGGDVSGPFVGTWQYTSGTATMSCPMVPELNRTEPLSGNETLQKGTSAPLVWADDTCSFLFDISGNTATARSGQTCMFTEDGISVTSTVSSLTFTATGMVATLSGTFNYSYNLSGAIVTCTITISGMLRRL